jgi:hypothetical protein
MYPDVLHPVHQTGYDLKITYITMNKKFMDFFQLAFWIVSIIGTIVGILVILL